MADQRAEATAPERVLPASIGRYRVIARLGEGAMGVVYRAVDPELERDVAVKVLRTDHRSASKALYEARFRNEARAAARFQHPNVVTVHDAGLDPVYGAFVVYELIVGRSLRAAIDEGPRALGEVAQIARCVGAALTALHGAEIMHRDIKPDNVMLGRDGSVKLTDFGVARVPDAALTREGQFLGTPAYAPPEAITRGEYSPRGDVFSMAAVLYEALTGVRPFPGEDAVTASYAVVHDAPSPPTRVREGLPPAVDAVFARGLSKTASERHESAVHFGEALAVALGERRRSAGPGADEPLPRGLVSAVFVLALALVGVLVFSRARAVPSAPSAPVSADAEAPAPGPPTRPRGARPRAAPRRVHSP